MKRGLAKTKLLFLHMPMMMIIFLFFQQEEKLKNYSPAISDHLLSRKQCWVCWLFEPLLFLFCYPTCYESRHSLSKSVRTIQMMRNFLNHLAVVNSARPDS